MNWLIWFLAGACSALLVWALTDKDTLYKYTIGRIKVKGRGNTVEDLFDMNDLPPGIKKRHIRKIERMKKRLRDSSE